MARQASSTARRARCPSCRCRSRRALRRRQRRASKSLQRGRARWRAVGTAPAGKGPPIRQR
eukprot:12964875-Heterocapsa_arctica.AAC.1